MTEIDPRLSGLYREAATETPPAAVDAAILAAARQRAAAPRQRPQTWWSRWRIPVSLTATLVVGVSLGLLVEREHPEKLRGDLAGPVPAAPDEAPARAQEKTAATGAGGPARMADSRARQAAPARRATPPAAATYEAETVPAPSPTRSESQPAAPALAGRPQEEAAVRSTAAKAAREAGPAADAAPGLGAAAKPAPATPEAWLDSVRRLLRAGRDREAALQLAEFRKAYPDYHVPEDLVRLQPSD